MPEKEDLRARMTKRMISDALLELITETAFENISVIDICKRSHVHRTTFYKHFEDKYQALHYVIRDILKHLEQHINQGINYQNPRQYYMAIFEYFLSLLKTDQKIRALMTSDTFSTLLRKLIVDDVTKQIEEHDNKIQRLAIPVHPRVVAEFHVGAFLSLIIWWLHNEHFCTMESLVESVDFMVRKDIYA